MKQAVDDNVELSRLKNSERDRIVEINSKHIEEYEKIKNLRSTMLNDEKMKEVLGGFEEEMLSEWENEKMDGKGGNSELLKDKFYELSYGESCIEGNCKNGIGKKVYKTKYVDVKNKSFIDFYEGEFKNGLLNGRGKITQEFSFIEPLADNPSKNYIELTVSILEGIFENEKLINGEINRINSDNYGSKNISMEIRNDKKNNLKIKIDTIGKDGYNQIFNNFKFFEGLYETDYDIIKKIVGKVGYYDGNLYEGEGLIKSTHIEFIENLQLININNLNVIDRIDSLHELYIIKEGEGKMTYKNGEIKEGLWKNDKFVK